MPRSLNVLFGRAPGAGLWVSRLAALPKREDKAARQVSVMTETRLREEICRLGRSLFERGLTPGSSGISRELDDGAGW